MSGDLPPQGDDADRDRVELYRQALLQRQQENALRAERALTGEQIRLLLRTPTDFVRRCQEQFDAFSQSRDDANLNLEDPTALRRYIADLTEDFTVALGAVFSKASDVAAQQGNSSKEAAAMERTFALTCLLGEQCGSPEGGEIGLARTRTLLRYMLEPKYSQGTELAEMLSRGTQLRYRNAFQSDRCQKWSPNLSHGDFVIDVGCGPGKTLDVFERIVGQGNAIGIDMNPLHELNDSRARIGVIDVSQRQLSVANRQAWKRLSFAKYFNVRSRVDGAEGMRPGDIEAVPPEQRGAKLVFSSLVLDRVANQLRFLQNCAALTRPGGDFVIGLLLPVRGEDDDPSLASDMRIQYVVDRFTRGEGVREDCQLVASELQGLGFEKVFYRHFPIKDPVTGGVYDNHYIIVAHKGAKA